MPGAPFAFPSYGRAFMKRSEKPWRAVKPGIVEIVEPPEPRTRVGRALRWMNRKLLGPPFSNDRDSHERLSKTSALAVIGADNIASSVYGPEAMLRALAFGGAAAFAFSIPLSWAIVVLLAIVATSYQQVIRAYPRGGGSYIVSRDSLGLVPSVVAASALMIDYVLDVAVSVAAGVQS